MTLIAIDPGKATGYCVLELPNTVVEADEVPTPEDARPILAILERVQPQEIVLEAFRLYPWQAENLSWDQMLPSQIIGAVKVWARERGIRVTEQPAAIKTRFSKTLLMAARAWVKGKPHARDAARHAFYRSWFGHKMASHKNTVEILKRAREGAVNG